MARLFLELHQGKLPNRLAKEPGVDAYDSDQPDLYWAVLKPQPPAGSVLEEFFAPEGPTESASAISHGNDSVGQDATTAPIAKAGIWRPKEPPYSFKILAPGGEEIELNPPQGGGETQIHSISVDIADGLGIWTIQVNRLEALDLPADIDGRRAVLNREFPDFTPAQMLRQPLLILDTDDDASGGTCPEIERFRVTDGCAPGTVEFEVTIDGDAADIEEVVWEFGDGEIDEQTDPPFSLPLTNSHNYTSVPSDSARVNVRRRSGCEPRTVFKTVDIPRCNEPDCPSIRSLEVRQGCVPGQVTFRLRINGAIADVEEITWTWGDGQQSVFTGGNLQAGLDPSHTYADVPADDPSVALRLDENCSPSVISETVDLPRCGGSPSCPNLEDVTVDGCAGSGEVTFTATGHNLGNAVSFDWNFGDGSETTAGATVTHEYSTRTARTIEVTMESPKGCEQQTQTVSRQVPACPRSAPPGNGSGGYACIILYVLFWACLILTLILALVASCTGNPAAIGLAIGIGLGTILLLILWLMVCGASVCRLLNIALDILAALGIIWPIIVGIATIFMPCLLVGGLIGEGFVGVISGIVFFVGLALGCVVQVDPFFGGAARALTTAARSRTLARLAKSSGCKGCGKRRES